MKLIIKIFFIISWVCLILLPVQAVEVSGTISGDSVWTADRSPYYVTGDITIASGGSLTIQPGVEVLFERNSLFKVNGLINAVGTQSDSIFFKRSDGNESGWKGILFESVLTGLRLDHCSISGGSANGIIIDTGFVSITNTISHTHTLRGLEVNSGSVQVINSVFKNNGLDGIFLGNAANVTLFAVRVTANGSIGINSPSGTLTAFNSIFDHNNGYGLYTNIGKFVLQNVVIDSNEIGLVSEAGDVNIINSIVYNNGAQSIVHAGGAIEITYSDIEGGGFIGDGNINQVPNYINSKYELNEETSPCVDNGNPGSLYYDQYFPPSKGSNINDMGAYGGAEAGKWYYPLFSEPDLINYGSVNYDLTVSEFVTIKNYSGDILRIDSISISGTNKNKFRIINLPATFPVFMDINDFIDFEIEFAPEEAKANPYEAVLNIKSEKGNKVIALVGKGVKPIIFISPDIEYNGIDFGEVNVGDMANFDLIIKNYGTGLLSVNDINIVGESVYIEDFNPFEIPPNPTLAETLKVKFKPVAADTLFDSLVLLSNDPDKGELGITLKGIGMAPEIAPDIPELVFGDIEVFHDSTLNMVISNSGNKDLVLYNAFLSDSSMTHFHLMTDIQNDSIPVDGEPVNLSVRFEPSLAGDLSNFLEITSNDPNTDTLKIALSGKSIAAQLAVTPESIDFGDVYLGQKGTYNTSIGNIGEKTLEVDTLFLEKGQDSEFVIQTESTSFNIDPGSDPFDIEIQFEPEEEMTFTDRLIIVSNHYLSDTLRFDVAGRGVTPHINYGPDSLDFSDVWLNQSLTMFKEIENTGTGILQIDSFKITRDDFSVFRISGKADSVRILPGEKDSIQIGFRPVEMGQQSAGLEFVSNDLDNKNVSILLTGRGVAALISSSDSTLDFGNVNTDSSANRTLFLRNTGNTDLEVSELIFENNNNNAFWIKEGDAPFTITADKDSQEIEVSFTPPGRMKSNAVLDIISNAYLTDTLRISLTATANVDGMPYLFITNDSVIILDNTILDGSSEFPLRIENLSDESELSIDSTKMIGPDAGVFSVKYDINDLKIPPLSFSEQLKIQFSPVELRTHHADFIIYSNDVLASPDTFSVLGTVITDPTPPVMILDTLSTQLTINQNGVFSTKLQDDESSIKKAWLYMRTAGKTQFDSVELEQSDDLYWSCELHKKVVTERGLEFYISAVHGGNRSRLPQDGNERPLSLTIDIPEFTLPDTTLAEAYQMISVPFNSKGQTLSDMFGDDLGVYDNTKYRIFNWNQEDNTFLEQTDMDMQLIPGKALYLITKDRKQLNITNCSTVKTDEPYQIHLTPGWNMISVPFAFPVSWDNIYSLANGSDLKYWNGTGWEHPDVLRPYKGYGFYSEVDTNLFVPAVEASVEGPPEKKVLEPVDDGWYIQIQAQRGKYYDNHNYAGVRYDSKDNLDRWDSREPPGIGDYISVFFTESGNGGNPVKLSSNYKDKENIVYRFDFEYKSTFLGKTLLNLSTSNMPETYDWYVVSREGNVLIPGNRISSNLKSRKYSLIVGDRDYINSIKSELITLPEQFSVSQNYPNPFNPVTKITIGLPKETYITVDIYDILGRRIKRLASNILTEEGYHEFTWDGKNENNRMVSSGIYFFTFRSAEYNKTIKMILQR